jgi:hypothetical protein
MKKRLTLACTIGIVMIIGGILTFNYSGFEEKGNLIGPPEGYQEPSTRAKNLFIERKVSKYFEVNAFAPGSGWVTAKTVNGMSPMLHLNKISSEDVQKFNQFCQSYNLPARVEYKNNKLYLIKEKTDTNTLVTANSKKGRWLWKENQLPRLAIRKDNKGKVFVVAVSDSKPKVLPGIAPEKEGIVVAKTD